MAKVCVDKALLDCITSPEDLRRMELEQLPLVCDAVRAEIIDVLSRNPGHLGSSLGAVELAVALHYVFNTPEDRIVWDVGHQAYAHNIITGRHEAFHTIRQYGGICPFPTPLESVYDTCICGHASNAISIALGMAVTARHQKLERKVVAVIGDGAMSGGLAFEGLNNVSSTPNDILIILNDNAMSIDRSVGGMKQYLLHLHTSPAYNNLRFRAAKRFESWGWLTEKRKRAILRFNNSIKALLFNQQNIFEGFDIRYFGPTDGNDVLELVRIISEIKEMKGPKLLHVHTVKGKGYEAAERDQALWHAPGRFNPDTGVRIVSDNMNTPPKYQTVFGESLLELAKVNDKIVGITPAMPTGCSLDIMMREMPERTFDVGIAEGHAVTFSAGMAKDGLMPFCNIYSSFAQRAYDNIIHDAAILNLPVVLCLDRAGLVGEDGPTHHGAFDLAALRPIPNITIASPMDEHELRRLMYTAQLPNHGTFVIRYPRGKCEHTNWRCPFEAIEVGTGRRLKDGDSVAIITIGPIGNVAARAIERVETQLRNQGSTQTIAHYDLRFLKPLDKTLLQEVGEKFDKILTVEDGVRDGGMGSAILEFMSDNGYSPTVTRLGLPDRFVEHGDVRTLYNKVGLDESHIADVLLHILQS